MDPSVLDYRDFYRLIEQFCGEVPKILAAHHTTADLAMRLSGLLDSMESGFTLAVVGQMRCGKSSLLNAVMGADLAITGVNETTATVNHFLYGTGEQCNRFRVYWRDRPPEEFPRSEIGKWIGDSQWARSTQRIEFFADVEFLRTARVVDTPGTRSTIEFHSDATRDFLGLADSLDAQTRRLGSVADAIIYVLMPIARQTDQDLLTEFDRNTRLPGAAPYNSIAVVHKWEVLNSASPLDEAQRKAERIAVALGNLVSEAIPVSAPLARAAESFPDAFWQQILHLTGNISSDDLDELLLSENDFLGGDDSRCPLTSAQRQSLRHQYRLPWPSLKAILQIAGTRRPGNAADLRSLIGQVSGIEKLRGTLQHRFFARSRMIKAFSLLAKAIEPCRIAAVRLRNHKRRYTHLLDAAHRAIDQVSSLPVTAAVIGPVQRYLDETRDLVEGDLRTAAETLRRLDMATGLLDDSYQAMNNDLLMLETLEQTELPLGDDWSKALRHLFGFAGPEIQARLAPLRAMSEAGDDLQAVEWAIGELRRHWGRHRGEIARVLEHALSRLEQIADDLEGRCRLGRSPDSAH